MEYPGVFIVLPEWIEACHNAVRFDEDVVGAPNGPSQPVTLCFPGCSQEHRVEEADFAVPGLPSVVPPR